MPTLLIVDLVAYFTDPGSRGWFAEAESAANATAEALRAARFTSMPCCFVRGGRIHHIHRGSNAAPRDREVWTRRFGTVELTAGEGCATAVFGADLAPGDDDLVLDKHRPSAFFGTGLDARLREKGVTDVLIAGIFTSGCIRATVTDAFSHGFNVVVLSDATGDRSRARHEEHLTEMGEKYANVRTVAEAFEAFRRE